MNHLTAETFDQAVSSGTVVVKFTGDGCGPCRMLQQLRVQIQRLARKYEKILSGPPHGANIVWER